MTFLQDEVEEGEECTAYAVGFATSKYAEKIASMTQKEVCLCCDFLCLFNLKTVRFNYLNLVLYPRVNLSTTQFSQVLPLFSFSCDLTFHRCWRPLWHSWRRSSVRWNSSTCPATTLRPPLLLAAFRAPRRCSAVVCTGIGSLTTTSTSEEVIAVRWSTSPSTLVRMAFVLTLMCDSTGAEKEALHCDLARVVTIFGLVRLNHAFTITHFVTGDILSKAFVQNRLFFAGEATNDRPGATAHAALETGVRAASLVSLALAGEEPVWEGYVFNKFP